jgi:hypothetical protein
MLAENKKCTKEDQKMCIIMYDTISSKGMNIHHMKINVQVSTPPRLATNPRQYLP